MADATKDTIYIDVDDEITNIIEKVKASPEKIVALVLPKRATVLQSIVNMKLLHRSATTAKKKVVLITSETGLLPLAGAVGVYVAKNLQSKPEIPDGPDLAVVNSEAIIDEGELDSGDSVDRAKSVGELAGITAVSAAATKPNKPAKAAKKPKSDSKFKIPNFEKFRGRLFLVIAGVVGLFIFLYWAFFMAPSAKITVVTDTATVNTEVAFTANTEATALNTEDKIVPAKTAEVKDVDSEKIAATGTKDVGTKASGTMIIYIKCDNVSGPPPSVPAGTEVSANGLTFITNSTVTMSGYFENGGCFGGSTQVSAEKNGDQYNLAATSYTVSGYPELSASGSTMTGGTSKTIKILSQADVDGAAKNLSGEGEEAAKTKLKKELEDAGYMVIDESFKKSKPAVSSSPTVGSEASEATVTATTTYTMTGVNKDDLDKLVSETAQKDIDTSKQQIVGTGLDEASFEIEGDQITITTIATAGPKIDVAATTAEIAGKKRSQVEAIIQANPGVKEVRVDYSPFWVSNTPKKTSKIQIVFEDATNE